MLRSNTRSKIPSWDWDRVKLERLSGQGPNPGPLKTLGDTGP